MDGEGHFLLSRTEFDPSGPIEENGVEQIFIRLTEIWHDHVDNQTSRTTGEQPFYAHAKGWTFAQDLTA